MEKLIYDPKNFLLPYQRQIFEDKSRFKIILSSRQIGKSFLCAFISVYRCLTKPGSLVAMISVNLRSASELLRKCIQIADSYKIATPNNLKSYVDFESSFDKIKFKNGSRIITLPAGSPESLRGFSGSLILDEFALVENDKLIWQSILPTITNEISGKDKFVLISSTPTSKNTQFAKIWFSDNHEWSKYKISIEDAFNDGLKVDIPKLKEIISDDLVWQTEYMCEFCSDSFDAFPTDRLMTYTDLPDNCAYYLGFDIARKHDFSAAVVLAEKDKKFYVVDIKKFKNLAFNLQLEEIKNLNKKYNFIGGYVDQTGIGSMLAEEITRKVNGKIKGLQWTATNKTPIHDRLRKSIFENELYVKAELLDTLKYDLNLVRRYISDTGKISYSAPHTSDGHADITSGLALAIHAVHENPVNFAIPISHLPYSAFENRAGIFCKF